MVKQAGGKGKGTSTGPTKDDLSIATQMSNMLSQMSMNADRMAAAFETQASATKTMAENMQGSDAVVAQLTQVNSTLKEIAGSLKNLNETSAASFAAMASGALTATDATGKLSDAAKNAAKAIDEQKSSLDDLREQLGKTGKNSLSAKQKLKAVGDYLEKDFPVATGAALGALSGLQQGFSNLISMGSSVLGFASSLVGSLFEIGQSIISIPFKMFDGLVNMAKKGMGGISELATALNNIRKEFGALDGPVASTIQNVAREMKGFSGAGVSAFQVFGNVAERMEQLTKLFAAGGSVLQTFTKEFKENGGAILGMQKGLGVTDEQLSSLAAIAKSTGRTLTHELIDMTKYATHLGKAFDVDFKLISKGMAKANADMAHFGSMSKKEVGIAVTYFAKLGVEVDKVTGAMDAFTTFDEAADKVSTLNQVFGTNIDAMKLVNAENPAEVIEHLREQFGKAGIDGEKMNRTTRALIKQYTNLDDAETKLIFSSKNRGLTLAQIRKEGDKAEKKTMTQTEAMSKLGDAMDRMLKAGQAQEGGFFGHFFKGFTDGLQRTKEFRELMQNIGRSLMVVYQAGVRLGRAFVEFFPGVKDFLGGLADIFKPEKFRKLANGVVDVFVGFFKDLESGKASFPDLMDRLKEKFFDFFDSEKGAGQKVMGGFKKIMMAIQVILAGGIKWIMESVAGFIKDIVNFIKNPADVAGAGGLADAANAYVSPIAQAFRDGWKVLGPALGDLMGVLFDKLGEIIMPKIKAFVKDYWPVLAAILFGPAALQALLGAGTAMFTKAIGGMVSKAFGAPDTQKQMLDQLKGMNEKLSKSAPKARTGSVVPPMSKKDTESLENMGKAKINWGAVGTFLIGFAGVMAIGLLTFYAASKMVEDMSTETVLKALGVMLGIAITAVPVAFAMTLLEKAPTPTLALVGKIAVMGVIMLALGAVGVLIAALASTVSMDSVLKGMALVMGMSIAAVAVTGSMLLLAMAGEALKVGLVPILLGLAGVGLVTLALGFLGVQLAKMVTEIDAGDIAKAVTLTLGMSLAVMMVSASFALLLAAGSLVSNPIAAGVIVVGLVAVGLAIYGLIQLAKKVVDATKDLQFDQVKKGTDIVIESAKVVGLAALALGAMILAGAAMFAGGMFTAGAAVAGFLAISKIIGKGGDEKTREGLVGLSLTIAEGVEKMPSDIGGKVDAFTKITDSLVKMMDVIPRTISALGDLDVDEDDVKDVLKEVTSMIDTMLGSRDSGTGLIGLVDKIITGISGMDAQDIEAAKAVGPILQGVGGIASALGGSLGVLTEAFKNIDNDDFEKLSGDSGVIGSMGKFVEKIGAEITKVISSLQPIIEQAAGITNVEGVKAVGALLQAIGPIAQAVTPSPEMQKTLQEVAKTWTESTTGLLAAMGTYINQVAGVLTGTGEGGDGKGGLLGAIIGVLNPLLDKLGTIKVDESTAKAVSSIVDLVKLSIDFVKSMASTAKDISSAGKVKFSDALKDIVREAGTMLQSLSEHLPKLIDGIAGGLSKAAKDITPEQLKNLEPIGKLVESILKLVVALMPKPEWPPAPDPSKVAAGAQIVTNMTATFPSMSQILQDMKEHLPALITTLVSTVNNLPIKNFELFKRNLDVIVKLFDVLPKITELGKAMSMSEKEAGTLEFSQEQGKKLAFALDGVAWGIKGIIDEDYYHSIGGVGRTPIKFFIDTFKDPLWGEAAKLKLDGPKAFLENLDKIVKVIKGFDSTAKDFTTSKEAGVATAASLDAAAWTLAYLADTDWYNAAGGTGTAPLPYFVKIFALEIWGKAQTAIAGKLPIINSLVASLKSMGTSISSLSSSATDFSTSKTAGMKAAAGIDAIAWALGGIADDNIYKMFGGTGFGSPMSVIETALNREWKGAGLLQKKQQEIIKFLKSTGEIATELDSLTSKLKMTGANAYGPMVEAIEQMMNAIGLIDAAVSAKTNVPIKTTLERFKANFGTVMGKSGKHVVSTKDVNIHVAFQVLMDTSQIDAAIVTNKESVIRQKINLLYGAIGGMDVDKVGRGASQGNGDLLRVDYAPTAALKAAQSEGSNTGGAGDKTGTSGADWSAAQEKVQKK